MDNAIERTIFKSYLGWWAKNKYKQKYWNDISVGEGNIFN